MTHERIRHRRGYGLPVGAGVLLLAFAGLTVYQILAGRDRGSSDPTLIAEMDAEFVEDEPPSADAGWPQWRGPRRDGVASAFDLPKSLPESPVWKVGAGRGFSSLAVVGDGVYTLLREDDQE